MRRSTPRTERGAAAVEFALILIPMLTLVFGIIQFSMYFYAGQSGAAASHDAVRRATVGDQTCAEMTSAARAKSGFVESAFTITRTYYPPNDTVARGAGNIQLGDDIKVVVQYKSVDFKFPFIPLPNNAVIREEAFGRLESPTTRSTPC